MVPGEGVLLFGNGILVKSIIHGLQNLMVITPVVGGICSEELVLQTYHVLIKDSDDSAVRTILSVIPAQLTSFQAFFTYVDAYYRAFHTSSLLSSSTNAMTTQKASFPKHSPQSFTASTDPEFANDPLLPFLKHYEVKFEPRPSRRHNKIGIVESKNNIPRTLARRLVKDADYFKTTRGTSATTSEILSR